MVQKRTTKLGYRLLSLLLTLSMLLSLTCISAFAEDEVDVGSIKSALESEDIVGLSDVFTAGYGTSDSPFQITSESDLIKLQLISNGEISNDDLLADYNSYYYFVLANDIALTASWTPIANSADNAFSDSFDGQGYTISGLNQSETVTAGESVSAYGGLFGYVDGATISNVNVSGSVALSVVTAETEETESSDETSDSESDDSSDDTSDTTTANSTAVYAGGVVAYAVDSAISGCSSSASVSITNADDDTVMAIAGGVVGYLGASMATDDDGSVTSVGTATASGLTVTSEANVSAATTASGDGIAVVAGGVIGLAQGATVTGATSAATVSVTGSSTAYSTSSYNATYVDMQGTKNQTVYNQLNEYYYSSTAGGVVGAAIGRFTIVNAETDNSTTGGNNSHYAAKASVAQETTVASCTSTATVTNSTGTELSFAGGVVGSASFSTISGSSYGGTVNGTLAGGIAGALALNATIVNGTLLAAATVTGTFAAGGIAGQVGGNDDSENYSALLGGSTGNSSSSTAHAESAISSSSTESGAAVTSESGYAGGIAGYVTYALQRTGTTDEDTGITTYSYAFDGDTNAASVSGNCAGGIAGYVYSGGDFGSCTNAGTVSGTAYAGGIAGYFYNETTKTVGPGPSYSSSTTASIVENCANSGGVSGNGYVGGIAGYVRYAGNTIDYCVNTGDVSGSEADSVGGLVGQLGGSMYNSYNAGAISGSATYMGGAVGYSCNETSASDQSTNDFNVKNIYNRGSVTNSGSGTSYTGGVFGGVYSHSYAANVYNVSTVTGAGVVGAVTGLLGYKDSSYAASLQNGYALVGTASQLIGNTASTAANDETVVSFFDTDLKTTDSTAVYGSLLVALNTYAADDDTLSAWAVSADGDYSYPVFSADVEINTPADATAPTFSVDGSSATSYEAYLGDTTVITASSTVADTSSILYRWYTAASADGDKTFVGNGESYTVEASAFGTTYLFVSATSESSNYQGTEVFSSAFAYTVAESPIYNGIKLELQDPTAENSEDNPYIINSAAKLNVLAKVVSAGWDTEGKYFSQTADLTLGADWISVGSSESLPFKGTYDGGNCTVTLATALVSGSTSETYLGVFGVVDGGTVKNLTVTGTVTYDWNGGAETIYAGGVAAWLKGGKIENCSAKALTLGDTSGNSVANSFYYFGGIVGYGTDDCTIKDCSADSDSKIVGPTWTGYSSTVYFGAGGIAGCLRNSSGGVLQNCTNAAVVSAPQNAGGIAGFASYVTASSLSNNGAVATTGTNYANAGGIIAYAMYSTVTDAANTGKISSENSTSDAQSQIGGIVGYCSNTSLYNASNTADVVGGYYAGGIAGNLYSGALYNAYNTGSVTGGYAGGGIAGYSRSATTANVYSAAAAVSGSSYSGGLIGYKYKNATVSNSYYLAVDDLAASPYNTTNVSAIGTFDTSEIVTAVSGYTLSYSGDLLSQLNGWVADNYVDNVDWITGWSVQPGEYPVFSDDYISQNMPAQMSVKFSAATVKADLNGDAALTATVSPADDCVLGTITYEWTLDDVTKDGGDISTETMSTDGSVTLSLTPDTSAPGTYVYVLTVTNATDAGTLTTSAEVTLVVNKSAGDTSWYGVVAESISGSGSEDDPYIIDDADVLAYVAQQVNAGNDSFVDKSYKLTTDLELNDCEWTPIGTSTNAFSGTFDGGGYTISGLSITSNASGDNYHGLFGAVSGTTTIKNVVVSGNVAGYTNVAGLVGICASSSVVTLENVGNEVNVTGTWFYTGGLVGGTDNYVTLTISDCYNFGSIAGTYSNKNNGTGGLVGYLAMSNAVTITNSYNAGAVNSTGSKDYVAGLIGLSATGCTCTLTSCFNAGAVTGGTSQTALVYSGVSATATGCYYISSACSTDSTGATAADSITASMLSSDDFKDVTIGTVTFSGEHVSVSVNGETVTSATAAMSYPVLQWQDTDGYTASVEFTLACDTGYGLTAVTAANGDSTITLTDGVYVIVTSSDDTVTIATSEQNSTITVSTLENASLSITDSAYITENEDGTYTAGVGAEVTFTVTPSEGYTVTSVTVNGTTLEADDNGSYSFTISADTQEYTLAATVAQISTLTVKATNATVTVTESDSVTDNGDGTYIVLTGSSVTFTITPISGYAVTKVAQTTDDGDADIAANEDGSYTITVGADVTVTVTAAAKRTVTVSSDNATLSITSDNAAADEEQTGVYTVAQGETLTFTVEPDSGYSISAVTVGSVKLEADESGAYSFTIGGSDITIVVSVKKTSWSSSDDVNADIQKITDSVAAETESKDSDGSTYDDTLDYNDDGLNDLLDILDILYSQETEEDTNSSADETAASENASDADAAEDETTE